MTVSTFTATNREPQESPSSALENHLSKGWQAAGREIRVLMDHVQAGLTEKLEPLREAVLEIQARLQGGSRQTSIDEHSPKDQILSYLNHANPHQRIKAIEIAAHAADPDLRRAAIERIGDNNKDVALAAINVFRGSPSLDVVKELTAAAHNPSMLVHRDMGVRHAAIEALHGIQKSSGDIKIVSSAREALTDLMFDSNVRIATTAIAGFTGDKSTFIQQQLLGLASKGDFLARNPAEVRIAALQALKGTQVRPHESAILGGIKDKDDRIAIAAIELAHGARERSTVNALSKRAKDTKHPDVRIAAIGALAGTEERGSIDTLLKIALNKKEPEEFRIASIHSLNQTHDAKAAAALASMLAPQGIFKIFKKSEAHPAIIQAVGEALHGTEDPLARQMLRSVLELKRFHNNIPVQLGAISALRGSTDETSQIALVHALRNPHLMKAAAGALQGVVTDHTAKMVAVSCLRSADPNRRAAGIHILLGAESQFAQAAVYHEFIQGRIGEHSANVAAAFSALESRGKVIKLIRDHLVERLHIGSEEEKRFSAACLRGTQDAATQESLRNYERDAASRTKAA